MQLFEPTFWHTCAECLIWNITYVLNYIFLRQIKIVVMYLNTVFPCVCWLFPVCSDSHFNFWDLPLLRDILKYCYTSHVNVLYCCQSLVFFRNTLCNDRTQGINSWPLKKKVIFFHLIVFYHLFGNNLLISLVLNTLHTSWKCFQSANKIHIS